MSNIKVEFAQLQGMSRICSDISKEVSQAKDDFQSAIGKLDWEVKSKSDINTRCKNLTQKLLKCSTAVSRYEVFINNAYDKYVKLDEYGSKKHVTEGKSESKTDTDGFTITKTNTHTGHEEVTETTDPTGIATQTISVNEHNSEIKVSPQGVDVKDEQKLYEYNLDIETKNMNGHVNASVGTVETEAGFKSDIVKMATGGYVEGESYDLVDAHISAEMTGLHLEISAGGNADGLGANVGLEVDVGKIEGEAHGKIGIDEKGNLVVDAGAKAMVTAVEGEISSTVQVGDIKADTTIKGYAGSIGVEGGIKYEDGKVTVEIGASLGFGFGVEVSIEPTGKTKEVLDAITNTGKEIGNCFKYGAGYFGHIIGLW